MVNKSQNSLQDVFLSNAKSNKTKLSVCLLNGTILEGFVTGFDSFTLILQYDDKDVMIYKHGILTITPSNC